MCPEAHISPPQPSACFQSAVPGRGPLLRLWSSLGLQRGVGGRHTLESLLAQEGCVRHSQGFCETVRVTLVA